MTKIFTDESGSKYRQAEPCPCCKILAVEPLPAPARTESDVMQEMDKDILAAVHGHEYEHECLKSMMMAAAYATLRSARELARMDLEKREK